MGDLIVFADGDFPFRMFSGEHFIPLGLLLAAAVAIYLCRPQLRRPGLNRAARYGMAGLLIVSEAAYHVWAIRNGTWTIDYSLPLHICGMAAWLSVVMLVSRSYAIFELVYFWGLAGTTQALLTPDIGSYSFPHFIYYRFFLFHGLIVLAVLFMAFVERYRPTVRSIGKTLVITNVYAAFVGVVDYLTGGNYMYLCAKPTAGSLLDYFGPWPWYIGTLEIILLLACILCYLPYIKSRGRGAAFPR